MIVKYVIPLLIFCVGVFSTSCDDMDALHIGFLEEGETIYAAKVDSASVGPGNGRVKMELFINAQRIEKLRIYWNAYTDSIDFNVGGQVGEFSLMTENLPEREYLFQIVSFDKYGNRSLPFEATGRACGEDYRNTLPNRHIENISKTEDGNILITWGAANDGAEKCVLTYTDATGQQQVREVLATVLEDIIQNVQSGSSFTYYTIYKPAANSPDSFNTKEDSRDFPE